jgi:peptide/nickel transport system ATP-binding protein
MGCETRQTLMDNDWSLQVQDAPESILSVRDLKTHFFSDEGTVKAVDGASFDLYAGKTLGIVGESGCGKTITAKSILRIVEKPGRIVNGQIWLRIQSSDRGSAQGVPCLQESRLDLVTLDPGGKQIRAIRGKEIGLVFQEPMTSFSAVHTVGNQIIEAIRLHQDLSKAEAKRRAIELLQDVGIPDSEGCLSKYPFQLSGGLRQRAMISAALSCDPRILIADEPTTALDVTTQAQILELLRGLQAERGMAIMLITHNMGVIAEMADDVAVMYLGRVVEEGPVDAVFHSAKHPYTRALLRSIPSITAPPRRMLPVISGSVPHPYNRPTGCPFHPRCPEVLEGICDQGEPALIHVAERHQVSCFLYDQSERAN